MICSTLVSLWKFQYFREPNIFNGAFIPKIGVKYIRKKAPSEMLTWVRNTPLFFKDSSNVLFLKVLYIIKFLKSVISLKYFTFF